MTEYKTLAEKISAESAEREQRYSQFTQWWAEAHEAGLAAGVAARPTPMIVTESSSGQQWHVDEGACGFAWIVVTPGNSSFANWARKTQPTHKEYTGGLCVRWVGEFNQSYERKVAYASAFAKVLRGYGINASSRSRLD